jgi:hypothetical protein
MNRPHSSHFRAFPVGLFAGAPLCALALVVPGEILTLARIKFRMV